MEITIHGHNCPVAISSKLLTSVVPEILFPDLTWLPMWEIENLVWCHVYNIVLLPLWHQQMKQNIFELGYLVFLSRVSVSTTCRGDHLSSCLPVNFCGRFWAFEDLLNVLSISKHFGPLLSLFVRPILWTFWAFSKMSTVVSNFRWFLDIWGCFQYRFNFAEYRITKFIEEQVPVLYIFSWSFVPLLKTLSPTITLEFWPRVCVLLKHNCSSFHGVLHKLSLIYFKTKRDESLCFLFGSFVFSCIMVTWKLSNFWSKAFLTKEIKKEILFQFVPPVSTITEGHWLLADAVWWGV